MLIRFFLSWICFLAFPWPSVTSASEDFATAVLYPDLREPYRSVFVSIADGIRDELGKSVVVRSLGREDTIPDIAGWVRTGGFGSVIALGRHGQSLQKELRASIPVVIGAVHMSPELQSPEYHGITLTPDPYILLKRLKELSPAVKRVRVVYHRTRNAWMIRKAREAAQRLGLVLDAAPVENLQEAAKSYQKIMEKQKSGTEALWLLQNAAVLDERALLPEILKTAWDKKLTVFSSNPSHVKRGVLFALYPDNYNMGRSLAKLARDMRVDKPAQADQGMIPLRDLMIAVNIRTAAHLGLNITRHQMSSFDLVFPSY